MNTQVTQPEAKPQGHTHMTNPPKDNKMVAPAKKQTVTMVKVVCLRPWKEEKFIRDENGVVIEDQSRMTEVGEIVDVTLKRAEVLIKPIYGAYAFSGERHLNDGDVKRHNLTLARRAVKSDLIDKKEEPLPAVQQEVWLPAD